MRLMQQLCNATIGLWVACLGLRLFRLKIESLDRRNRAQRISPVVAAPATNGLQEQQRKHVSFEESTRPGTVSFLYAASAAAEFPEKPAPRGPNFCSHRFTSWIRTIVTLFKTESCGYELLAEVRSSIARTASVNHRGHGGTQGQAGGGRVLHCS